MDCEIIITLILLMINSSYQNCETSSINQLSDQKIEYNIRAPHGHATVVKYLEILFYNQKSLLKYVTKHVCSSIKKKHNTKRHHLCF